MIPHDLHANKKTITVAVIISLIILATGTMLLWNAGKEGKAAQLPTQPINCEDRNCFLQLGKDCREGSYTTQIAGAVVYQEVKQDCSLVRTIQDITPEEPASIQSLKGLSMTCKYERNNFHPKYSDTITGFQPQCKGELLNKIRTIVETKPSK